MDNCPKCGGIDIKSWVSGHGGIINHCRPCKYRWGIKSTTKSVRGRTKDGKDINTIKSNMGYTETGNTATVNYKGSIRTLEHLLSECQVDLNEWKVDSYTVNKWEQGSKVDSSVITTPLFQIKARLIAKNPKPIEWPFIAPVQILSHEYKKIDSIEEHGNNIRSALIIPDTHHGFNMDRRTGLLDPYHNRDACDIILQVCKFKQFDEIILLGDHLDLAEWSDKYFTSPEMYWTTQSAAIELSWFISQIRLRQPGAKMYYIEGNHEVRMTKAIVNNQISAAGLMPVNDINGPPLMSISRLLSLDSIGVEYIGQYPHGEVWLNDHLRVAHGDVVRKGGGNSGLEILKDARSSECYGHVHRMEIVARTLHTRGDQRSYYAMSFGTLARIDGIVPSNSARNDWQNGFGIISYNDKIFNIQPVPVFGNKCIINNMVVAGKFYVDGLYRDTNWEAFVR